MKITNKFKYHINRIRASLINGVWTNSAEHLLVITKTLSLESSYWQAIKRITDSIIQSIKIINTYF